MRTEKKILTISNLNAGYNGTPVLRDLDIHLDAGEICGIMGEEGSGKSTLLKAITQQIKTTGQITYRAHDLTGTTTSQMTTLNIDFISQRGNILPDFTVEEHISLALVGKSSDEQTAAWQGLGNTFPKLIPLRKQVAGRLSGGERMILSLGCLMATDADFWILDEPTAGLAPQTCQVIEEFLVGMRNVNGKTMLILEHNYEFVAGIADSIVILKEGTGSQKYLPADFQKPEFIETELYG